MQGEIEPLLPPGASRADAEDRWVQEDGRRRGQHKPWWYTVRKVGLLVVGSSVVIGLAVFAIFSPELLHREHESPPTESPSTTGGAPPGMHAAHSWHIAHKNLARKHEAEVGATSSLTGTAGFFAAEATSDDLIDKTVSPCNDFYEHACGEFNVQPLPGDHDQWLYAFDGVKGRVARKMRKILSSPSSGAAGRLFRSCIDDEAIERAGTAPLTQFLLESQMMNAAANLTAAQTLVHTVATLHTFNSKAFFFWNVGADADSSTQVMYMEQGGLTLPSHTYYLNSDAVSKAKVAAFHTLVSSVFALLGHEHNECEEAAAAVVKIETEIAQLFLSHAEERTANSLPPLSFKQVAKGMSTGGPRGFDWMLFFESLGIRRDLLHSDQKVVRVLDVKFYQSLCSLLAAKPVGYWDHYLKWNFLDPLIGHLGKDFQHADLLFRKALYGVTKDPPRWRICLHTLNSFVPATVGAVYKEATFREDSSVVRDAHTLLKLLRSELNAIIASSLWMSQQSRTVAQSKLRLMDFEVGGSAHVEPLPFSVQPGGGWFNNSVHIAKALVAHQVHKLGTVEGRRDWGQELGPMSVNAFYNVHANTLFVPAALLQDPFFPRNTPSSPTPSASASSASTGSATGRDDGLDPRAFGSIGGLLGHEMSHGFDNVGRLFGPDLVIKSWWDSGTKAHYSQRAQCVGNYYHSFKEAGRSVDGNTTLGEDIADKGGLHTAYKAMLTYLEYKLASHNAIESSKRHFFEAWAQTWCHISTQKMKRDALLTDPHAPSRVRVNAALSQFAPFRKTFNCPSGAPMAPPIKPHCTLW